MPQRSIFDLGGRTALVTGASSGLGQHFARTLAAHGAAVALAARRIERLAALAGEIRDAGGVAHPVCMDVTDAGSVAAGLDAVQDALGVTDVLVNNYRHRAPGSHPRYHRTPGRTGLASDESCHRLSVLAGGVPCAA